MSKTIYISAYRNLIARLREQRIRAGLMQSDVGKRLGVARSLIGKIERCEVRLDVVGLVRLARVYRTSARDLIAGLEKELSDEDGSFLDIRSRSYQPGGARTDDPAGKSYLNNVEFIMTLSGERSIRIPPQEGLHNRSSRSTSGQSVNCSRRRG